MAADPGMDEDRTDEEELTELVAWRGPGNVRLQRQAYPEAPPRRTIITDAVNAKAYPEAPLRRTIITDAVEAKAPPWRRRRVAMAHGGDEGQDGQGDEGKGGRDDELPWWRRAMKAKAKVEVGHESDEGGQDDEVCHEGDEDKGGHESSEGQSGRGDDMPHEQARIRLSTRGLLAYSTWQAAGAWRSKKLVCIHGPQHWIIRDNARVRENQKSKDF